MKKAFISIYALFVLLIVSLTITFIYNQQKSTSSYANTLYEKKQAQYLAESIINSFVEDNSDWIAELIINDYDESKNKEETSSRFIIENQKYIFGDKIYYINISRIYHQNRKELSGLYMIFIKNGVSVGSAKSEAEIYIRVFDEKDENSDQFDKNRLRIEIRHAY